MREHHVEFESTTVQLGIQLGQARFGLSEGSPDLLPTFIVGWNWRIYFGFTLGWLIWYANFYIITPAYVKEINKRREYLRLERIKAMGDFLKPIFPKE